MAGSAERSTGLRDLDSTTVADNLVASALSQNKLVFHPPASVVPSVLADAASGNDARVAQSRPVPAETEDSGGGSVVYQQVNEGFKRDAADNQEAAGRGGRDGPPEDEGEATTDGDNSVPQELITAVGQEKALEIGRLARAMVGFQHFRRVEVRLDEAYTDVVIDSRTRLAVETLSIDKGGISLLQTARRRRDHIRQIRAVSEEKVPHIEKQVDKVTNALLQAKKLIAAFVLPEKPEDSLPLTTEEFLTQATMAYDSLFSVPGTLPRVDTLEDITKVLKTEINGRAIDRMATGYDTAPATQRAEFQRLDRSRSTDLSEANLARKKRDKLMNTFEKLGDEDEEFLKANRTHEEVTHDLTRMKAVIKSLEILTLQFEGSNETLITHVRSYFNQPIKDFARVLIEAQEQLATGVACNGGELSVDEKAAVERYLNAQAQRMELTAKVIGLQATGPLADKIATLKEKKYQRGTKEKVKDPAKDVPLSPEFNDAAGIFRKIIKGDFKKDRVPAALLRNLMLLDENKDFRRGVKDSSVTAIIDDEPLGSVGRGLLAAIVTNNIDLQTMKEINAIDVVMRGLAEKSDQSNALMRENADRYNVIRQALPPTFTQDYLIKVVRQLDGLVSNFTMRQIIVNNLMSQIVAGNAAEIEKRVQEGVMKIKTYLETKDIDSTQDPQRELEVDDTVKKKIDDMLRVQENLGNNLTERTIRVEEQD